MNANHLRTKNLLSVLQIMTMTDGAHADGDRLMFRVKGGVANAVFTYTSPAGERRQMGLGTLHRGDKKEAGESLTRIRRKAEKARSLLDDRGIDPLGDRARKRAEAKAQDEAEHKRAQASLRHCLRTYHARVIEGRRTAKHAYDWIASVERHIPPAMLDAPVDTITPQALFDVLAPKQQDIVATIGFVRQRLEAVFSDAEFRGLRVGNPAAAIRKKMQEEAGRRIVKPMRALDYRDVPEFMAKLRAVNGIPHRLLEFTILCGCRPNESTFATWSEIDATKGIWSVPADRMKARKPHQVALSPRALEIVLQMKQLQDDLGVATKYVFMTPRLSAKVISTMAMFRVLRELGYVDRTTVHGFRSCFASWAYERSGMRGEVIEGALAHVEPNKVKAAYARTNYTDDRARLIRMWHDYVLGITNTGSNVIPMVQAQPQPVVAAAA